MSTLCAMDSIKLCYWSHDARSYDDFLGRNSFFLLGKGHGGLYKAPTKEESEKLRGGRDQVRFIDLRFELWQVVRFRKGRRRHHKLHVIGMKDDL